MGIFVDATVYNMRTDYIAGVPLVTIAVNYGIPLAEVKAALLALVSGSAYTLPPGLYAGLSPY